VSQPFYTTFKKNEEEEKKYSLEKKRRFFDHINLVSQLFLLLAGS